MENMNQLRDLLLHEVKDLCSAEEQIIDALPAMIEKANNSMLKKALEDHLTVTETHRERLDKILKELNEEEESGGFLSGLFSGRKEKCKATEGLIKEGKELMKEDMTPEVMDAAIIAAAQKIEHYEIASYGTARTFARELGLTKVEQLLKATLDEEYEADDLLTNLAESRINRKAISDATSQNGRSASRSSSRAGKKEEMATASDSRRGQSGRSSSSKSSRGSSGAPAGRASRSRSASTERSSSRGGSSRSSSSSGSKTSSKRGGSSSGRKSPSSSGRSSRRSSK